MSKTCWFIVISILIGMVGSTGCATMKAADHWLSQPSGIEVASHGHQPVIFANIDKRQATVTIKVRKIGPYSTDWLDELTLHPGESALIFYGEGKYEAKISATETGGRYGSKKFFVPYRGRNFIFNGNHYAAGVIVGRHRR